MLRAGRFALLALEIAALSALVFTTRCANYRQVFVGGGIYFTDADCYARMTRARICFEQPGVIVRHHSFENYPAGTSPHTTAPLDYLIVALATALQPFSRQALDLAGAIVSPLLALIGGWFLWWWAIRRQLAFRVPMLLLYATSPMLVHGAELGRPDHQSLLIVLVIVALCAEWSLLHESSRRWSIVSGAVWALALWVSLYEPLVLLGLLLISYAAFHREQFTRRDRRAGGFAFLIVFLAAAALERRLISWPVGDELLARWSATVGELGGVPLSSGSWLEWCGYLVIVAPVLLALSYRRNRAPPLAMIVVAIATFALTIWQARWGYFFVGLLVLLVPAMLAPTNNRAVATILFLLCLMPIVRWWDAAIWPEDSRRLVLVEQQRTMRDVRAAAGVIAAGEAGAVLGAWWLSPAIAYWSRQNAVAGSSHEGLAGIVDSARFFITADPEVARAILTQRNVRWIIASDAGGVISNSAAILGSPPPATPLAAVLDRTPSRAPAFLQLVDQNGSCKVFKVRDFSAKSTFPKENN